MAACIEWIIPACRVIQGNEIYFRILRSLGMVIFAKILNDPKKNRGAGNEHIV